jgi:GNAT superfamily N-acetyltransferase
MEEDFETLWPDMQEHLIAHWQEVSSFPDYPLDVDVDKFTTLQNDGMLVCCSARDEDKLVGYVVDFIQFHPHYKTVKTAITDAYYIAPEYRAKCARGLMKFVEKVEKEIGVFARITRSKNTNNAGKFFKAMGYKEAEVAWSKRL